MKKSLTAVVLALLSLPFSCKVVEGPAPNPLAKREGFCQAWAQYACQDKVLAACQTPDPTDCESTQSDFCLGIIPEAYSSEYASECLSAVKAAYKDADLTAEELGVVIKLEAPCDKLSEGIAEDGESCSEGDECNTAGGFKCITKLGEAEGVCGTPEVVGPGEACDGPNQVCEDGNFCTGEYCVVYKETGDKCRGDYECTPEDHCVFDPADAETGTCELRGDLSDKCAVDDDCQSRFCVVPSGEALGKCGSFIRLSINEPLCDNLR